MADNKTRFLFGTKEKTEEVYAKNVAASKYKDAEEPQPEPENVVEFEPADEAPLPDPAREQAVLFQLGSQKESGAVNATWDEIADVMNGLFRQNMKPETESSWRKKYVRLRDAITEGELEVPPESIDENVLRDFFHDLDKAHQRMRDERLVYTRQIRSQSRQDQILQLFRETIQALPPATLDRKVLEYDGDKAIYAMLSDLHYGLKFRSYAGEYNTTIAEERVMAYADEIIRTARREQARFCFVSLMGDMVSGIIHQTIRVENQENIIDQVVHVSELVAKFLFHLSGHFENVFVNSVDGNHSRLEPNLENALRGERLDSLIPWYCKSKLDNQPNITFLDNEIDSSVASFRIGSKLYIAVHGDLEKEPKTSVINIERSCREHIDYFLSAHLHVPEVRVEETMYIRNGSVCGSGDDYTMKKRLFGPPCQVFMVLNNTGAVESIHTVDLSSVNSETAVAKAE